LPLKDGANNTAGFFDRQQILKRILEILLKKQFISFLFIKGHEKMPPFKIQG
jgi:hypothetical protein